MSDYFDNDGDVYAETVMTDSDGNGYYDIGQYDLNLDGYYETVTLDADANGTAEAIWVDTNADGYFETVAVDSNYDGAADTLLADYEGDGSFGAYFPPADSTATTGYTSAPPWGNDGYVPGLSTVMWGMYQQSDGY